MRKKGVVWINFAVGVSEEEIQNIINTLYADNREHIVGMEYNEFRDDKAFKIGREAFKKSMEE